MLYLNSTDVFRVRVLDLVAPLLQLELQDVLIGATLVKEGGVTHGTRQSIPKKEHLL
jgi:hypothetical protein